MAGPAGTKPQQPSANEAPANDDETVKSQAEPVKSKSQAVPGTATATATAQPPKTWGIEEVLAWADCSGLGPHVQTRMEEEKATGKLLLRLDDEAWKALGVTSALQVAKLRLNLQELEEEAKVGVVLPPAPGLLQRVPVVNLFADMVGAEAPELEAVRTSLDTLGLLGALFITVAMTLPASVEYEEVADAVARLDSPPYNGVLGFGEVIAKNFVLATCTSVLALGSSLISTVIMLVSMALIRDDIEGNFEVRTRWWGAVRWLLLWNIVSIIVGIVSCFFSFNRMVFLKFPDFHVERTGNWSWMSPDSTYGLFRGGSLVMLIGTAIIAFGCTSWAKLRTSFVL